MTARGFALIECLIALTLTAMIAAAVSALVPSARSAFDRTPAALDLQQRTRTAVQFMHQSVRSARAVSLQAPDESGLRFSQMLVATRAPEGAEAVLDGDQADAGDALVLSSSGCPSLADVCGFRAGLVAMIADGAGRFDLFTVEEVDLMAHAVTSDTRFDAPYPAGAVLFEVDAYTLGLVPRADGSNTLVRHTYNGAVQPVVDGLSAMTFEWRSPRALAVSLRLEGMPGQGQAPAERALTTTIVARNLP